LKKDYKIARRGKNGFDTGKFDLDFSALSDPLRYVGRSREQVDEFGKMEVAPIRDGYSSDLGLTGKVEV